MFSFQLITLSEKNDFPKRSWSIFKYDPIFNPAISLCLLHTLDHFHLTDEMQSDSLWLDKRQIFFMRTIKPRKCPNAKNILSASTRAFSISIENSYVILNERLYEKLDSFQKIQHFLLPQIPQRRKIIQCPLKNIRSSHLVCLVHVPVNFSQTCPCPHPFCAHNHLSTRPGTRPGTAGLSK